MRFLSPLWILAACSSSVDLSLETGEKGGNGRPGPDQVEDEPDEPGADPAGWPITDLPDTSIGRLEWTPEEDLLAATYRVPADAPGAAFLRRHDPDGVERWSAEVAWAAGENVQFTAFAGTPGGGTVAALADVASLAVASLRTYDASGALLTTRELTATDASDAIALVNDIAVLVDGGFILAGATGEVGRAVVARFDAGGALQWTVPIHWLASDVAPGSDEPPPSPADAIRDLSVTADGGLVFQGRYHGDVVVGGCAASNAEVRAPSSAYVARVELDGTCSWLQTIVDHHDVATAWTLGMGVTTSGNILLAGTFDGLVTAGDRSIEDRNHRSNIYYTVELDPAGAVVSLDPIARSPLVTREWDILVGQEAVVRGDGFVLAGSVSTLSGSDPFGVSDSYVAFYDQTGDVTSEILTATPRLEESGGFAVALALSPGGRVALGGVFAGEADFGAGPVQTEPSEPGSGFSAYEPSGYIAVFGAADVD